MSNLKENSKSLIWGIIILLAVLLAGKAFKNRNINDDTITVTGFGKKDFVSDLVMWRGNFERINFDLKIAYSELNSDREKLKAYLVKKGIKGEEMTFSSIDMSREYRYSNYNGESSQEFAGFRLFQNVKIKSKEVDKVERISREVTELLNNGVEFYSNPPEYYYTKLDEVKKIIIASATKEGKERADKIAEESGQSLGSLKNANMGVFQIVAQNSNEDQSWGGAFNVSSKEKTATITVKLQFMIR